MSKKTLHIAYAAAGLTPTGMADLLRNATGKASEEQATRLQSIIGPLCNMAFTDGRKFLSDTVASTKATKDDKPDAVVKVRASEAGTIYGAVKMLPGFKTDGLGWHGAVTAAREALKAAGIKASGDKVLTDEQKATLAIAKVAQPIMAEMLVNPANGEMKASEVAAQAQKLAAAKVAGSEVEQHAARIVKAQGADYGRLLIKALAQVIAKAEQNIANPGEQVQQAVKASKSKAA